MSAAADPLRWPWCCSMRVLLRVAVLSLAFLLCLLYFLRRPQPPTLLLFGILSDAQYANAPPGRSVRGTPRYYRESLRIVREAVAFWGSTHPREGGVQLVVNLGDSVDARAARSPGGSTVALEEVLGPLDSLRTTRPVYHLAGNHEWYQRLGRARTAQLLGVPGGRFFRSAVPSPGVRLIFLDTFTVSALAWPPGSRQREEAQALLDLHNPGAEDKNSPDKLAGAARRWVKLNGGLGGEQLAWLDAELASAFAEQQKVLLFSHVPLHPKAQSWQCGRMCTAWDGEEAVAVLRRWPGVVAAAFAGHDHFGGAAYDAAAKTHFVTLQGVIETKPGDTSFGEVELFADGSVRLTGHGRMRSRRMR